MAVGPDRQVGPRADRFGEIADGCGNPCIAFIEIGRDRIDAVLPGAVLVVAGGKSVGLQLGFDMPHEAGMERARDALHRDRAEMAVDRIAVLVVEIVFELAEERQDAVPVPAPGAFRRPFVIVGRRAPIGADAVDRRAAAENARLLIRSRRSPSLGRADAHGDAEARPGPVLVEIGAAGIGRGDDRGDRAWSKVLSRFDQQDLAVRILGQARRKHASGRTAAENDDVETVAGAGLRWTGHRHAFRTSQK